MAVKFLRSCQQGTMYNKDEVAGFEPEVEKRLIEQKFAEAVKKVEPAPKA